MPLCYGVYSSALAIWTRCPKCLSNVSPPATNACPFSSTVMVSPRRDLFILPVVVQVSVEGSKSAANPEAVHPYAQFVALREMCWAVRSACSIRDQN